MGHPEAFAGRRRCLAARGCSAGTSAVVAAAGDGVAFAVDAGFGFPIGGWGYDRYKICPDFSWRRRSESPIISLVT